MEPMPLIDFKIRRLLAVGDAGCGKNTLLNAVGYPGYTGKLCSFLEIHQTQVVLYLTSISSKEADDQQRAQCYSNIDVVLLCFSIDNPVSLTNVETKWIQEVRQFCPGVPVLLIGLKRDLRTDQSTILHLASSNLSPVSTEDALTANNTIGAYSIIESSVVQKIGVLEPFLIASCVSTGINIHNITRYHVDAPSGLSLTYDGSPNVNINSQISYYDINAPLPLHENYFEENLPNVDVQLGNLQNVYWVENLPNENVMNGLWLNNVPNGSHFEQQGVQNRYWLGNFEERNMQDGYWEEKNVQNGCWVESSFEEVNVPNGHWAGNVAIGGDNFQNEYYAGNLHSGNLEAEIFPEEYWERTLPNTFEHIDSSDSNLA